jgi:hypothetical protein
MKKILPVVVDAVLPATNSRVWKGPDAAWIPWQGANITAYSDFQKGIGPRSLAPIRMTARAINLPMSAISFTFLLEEAQ